MTIETPNIKGRRLRVLIAGCTALIAVPSLAISQADDELIVLEFKLRTTRKRWWQAKRPPAPGLRRM